jgi:hypothetical protein
MAILWLSYLLKTYDEIIEALPSCTVSEPWQALQDYFTRSLKLSLQSKLRCGVDHYFATITWSSCPEAFEGDMEALEINDAKDKAAVKVLQFLAEDENILCQVAMEAVQKQLLLQYLSCK